MKKYCLCFLNQNINNEYLPNTNENINLKFMER